MDINELRDELAELSERYLDGSPELRDLRSIGLDPRSAPVLWIGDNFIAVALRDDHTLKYYGGFEYVDKSCRIECGEYVFYSVDDNRVYHCHEAYGSDEDAVCSTCSGSGEGMYDGARCSSCGGSGVEREEE